MFLKFLMKLNLIPAFIATVNVSYLEFSEIKNYFLKICLTCSVVEFCPARQDVCRATPWRPSFASTSPTRGKSCRSDTSRSTRPHHVCTALGPSFGPPDASSVFGTHIGPSLQRVRHLRRHGLSGLTFSGGDPREQCVVHSRSSRQSA